MCSCLCSFLGKIRLPITGPTTETQLKELNSCEWKLNGEAYKKCDKGETKRRGKDDLISRGPVRRDVQTSWPVAVGEDALERW
jgi:hypothetical protein